MKVAIIGGGLAGIACATQLERMGIIPHIYERNSVLGEPYRHVGAILQIILRPIKDPLTHMKEEYNIHLQSSGPLKKIIHTGPTTSTAITGELGVFLYRGAVTGSIESQLAGSLNSTIYLNTEADVNQLRRQYDYVVVATGNPGEAKQMGIWTDSIKMSTKITTITGDFEPDTFQVWLNKDYCKAGYAYLSPFNRHEATLALAVDGIELDEVEMYWALFLKIENLKYEIKETYRRNHYAGHLSSHRVGNVLFVGNAGGFMDPLLGFGIYPSIVTGYEAARSIAFGADYESGVQGVLQINNKYLEYRKAFTQMNNTAYDLLIRSIGLPGVNGMVYNTNINYANIGHGAVKPFNKLLGWDKNRY